MNGVTILYIIFSITTFFEVIILIYALARNEWVYKERIKLMYDNISLYEKLPSYDEMLYGHGFWRWDINYYLKGKGR